MQRIEMLKAWDEEVEREWEGLPEVTAAVLERLPGQLAEPAELRRSVNSSIARCPCQIPKVAN